MSGKGDVIESVVVAKEYNAARAKVPSRVESPELGPEKQHSTASIRE